MAIATELNINTTATADDMFAAIFGDGIQVVAGTATYSGGAASSGTYTGALTTIPGIVPTDSGVILSTGNVADFTNSSGTTDTNVNAGTGTDVVGGIDGDAQLNAVSGQATYDGAILEADFIPDGDMLTMQFVFTSEEYPEFVNSGVNDSFGVWINGQFVEATISVAGNISIDSVNAGANQNLYRDNTGDQYNTEMDGITYVLSFKAPVNAGEVNHIKIGIADGGDQVYDSNLLIMGDSIQTYALAMDDTIQLTANSNRTFDILANDRDESDGGLTITHLNGTAVVAGQTVTLTTGEQVRLNADGTVTVFSGGIIGSNALNYTIVDSEGNTDVGFIIVETVSVTGPDGIVQGTAGADVIQTGYLGDPDGDRIDNNDGQGVAGTVGNDDYIMAGAGNDSIVANLGNDIIYAGTGDDTAFGGAGDDWVSMGAGNDSFGSFGTDSAGNDTVYGDAGNDYLIGGGENDVLYGGSEADTLSGGVGSDTMYGGDDADVFMVTDDHQGDTVFGGEGGNDNDVLAFGNFVSTNGVNLTATGDETGTYAYTGTASGTTGAYSEIEAVAGTIYNDNLNFAADGSGVTAYGLGGNDTIAGGAGNDVIFGNEGNDAIHGAAGNDTVYGGDGDDTQSVGDLGDDLVYGGLGNDVLSGDAGNDTVYGDEGNDALEGHDGADTIYGGTGNDYIAGFDVSGLTTPANRTLNPNVGSDDGANDLLVGGDGNDTILGGAGNDTLTGDLGNDALVGGAGADSLSGGNDADTIYGGAGDTVVGGEGGTDNDTLVLNYADVQSITYGGGNNEAGTVTFTAASGGGTLTFSEIENVTFAGPVDGTAGADSMGIGYVDVNGDIIDGADGDADTILAGAGNDTVVAGNGNDLVDLGAGDDSMGGWSENDSGNDTISGGLGNDSINAGSGNDSVLGGDGNDIVYGSSGDDTLIGDAGADRLFGGVGNDISYGGVGNDTLQVVDSDQGETLFGGADTDHVQFSSYSSTSGVNVTFTGAGAGTFAYASTPGAGSFAEIETFGLTEYNDTFNATASTSAVTIGAGGGNDVIRGGSAADSLSGDADADTIHGGAGDTVVGGETTTTGTDNDILVLNYADVQSIAYGGGNNEAGTVTFYGGGTLSFSEIENIAYAGPVDGTSGSDSMAAGYTDINGDQVDGLDGVNDTIFGNGGNDTINSGDGNDLVYGGTGNDVLRAQTGNDTLYGDIGNDDLQSGTGNDVMYGGDGAELIHVYANSGADTVFGGEGNDPGFGDILNMNVDAVDAVVTFTGNEAGNVVAGSTTVTFSEIETIWTDDGNDTINASAATSNTNIWSGGGNDFVTGGSGNDYITAQAGNDEVFAGAGNDYVYGDAGVDQVYGGDGNDQLYGGVDNDYMQGDAGNDLVDGGTGDDFVRGDAGNDLVYGGAGNDSVYGGADSDTVYGEDGNDQVYGGFGDDTVYGGAGNDSVTGSGGNDVVYGDDGDDFLQGSDGNDTIYGGAGADTMLGEEDADSFHAASNDYVDGGETVTIGTDNDTLYITGIDHIDWDILNPENGVVHYGDGSTVQFFNIERVFVDGAQVFPPDFVVEGTAGSDLIDASYAGDPEGDMIDAADNLAGNNDDVVQAGAGNDTVLAGVGNDLVYGDLGNDSLLGGAGDDSLFGGDGNDTLQGDAGADTIFGGMGNDTVYGGDGNDILNGDDGDDVFLAGAGDDLSYGGDGNDVLWGNAGSDTQYGGAGHDVLTGVDATGAYLMDGGTGNDTFYSGTFNDTVYGGDGDDLLEGTLYNNLGDDLLNAGAGNDTVNAGDGNDTVQGGADDDSLSGGAGDDRFDLADGFGDDTITGGETGETNGDSLSLSGLTGAVTVDLSAANPETGTVTQGGDTAAFTEIENIVLGAATETIVLADGSGDDAVQGFELPTDLGGGTYAGVDQLDVSGLTDALGNPVNTDDVSIGTDGNGNAVLTFPNGESLTLIGVNPSLLANPAVLVAMGIPAVTLNYIVEGGAGDDLIDGTYAGDPQGDMIDAQDNLGSNNDDVVTAGAGNDSVYSGAGDDSVLGEAGNDYIYAGTGNDTVSGGDGADYAEGGMGDDDLSGDLGSDTLYGGLGNDTVTGGLGNDWLDGGAGNDELNGGAGDDTLTTGDGNDALYGGDDADLFNVAVNAGDTTVEGGEGGTDNDTLNLVSSTNAVELVFSGNEAGTATHGPMTVEEVTFAEIERFILTSQDDYVDAAVTTDGTYVQSGAGNDTLLGGSGNDSLFGESGNDSINAGAGDDLVDAGVGNDYVFAGTGNDTVYGSLGDDTISGWTGDNLLDGGEGNDTISAEGGNDTLNGNEGNDLIFGGAGDDSIRGGDGNDIINAGDGVDTVFGDAGADTFVIQNAMGTNTIYGGEAGNDNDTIDLLNHSGAVEVIYTGTEAGTIDGGASGTTTFSQIEALDLTQGNDTVDASADTAGVEINANDGNDQITGGSGADLIYAGSGDDTVSVLDGFGSDTLLGGETGEVTGDVLDASGLTGDSVLNLAANESGAVNEDGALTAGGQTLTFQQFESVILGAGNDSVIGSTGDDVVTTGAGQDTIDGGAGNDSFDLTTDGEQDLVRLADGDGNDTLTGFEAPADNGDGTYTGHDLLDVSGLTDAGGSPVNTDDVTVSDDGNGNAVLTFPNGETITLIGVPLSQVSSPDQLAAMGIPYAPDLVVDGTSGDDTMGVGFVDIHGDQIDGTDGDNDVIMGYAGNDSIVAGVGHDTIYGGSGNDTIWADDATSVGNDVVYGDEGDDSLTGGLGNDTLYGGDDNDTLSGSDGDDSLLGGAGNDSARGATGNDYLSGGLGDDTLDGGSSNDTIDGGDGNDSLLAGSGDDLLFGGAGNDTISASTGNDLVDAGTGDDLVSGGTGNDTVLGGDGADTLHGEGGDDSLTGGAGNDSLFGWADNDTVSGGDGDDMVDGDEGNDSLSGDLGNDTLVGDAGNDTLSGGDGVDQLYGGTGNDSLTGGDGADLMSGGDDRDTFFGGIGDVVDGGEGGDDYDVLDLTAYGHPATNIIYDAMNPENGTVEFLDSNGDVVGTMTFSNIENVVACFTPGAMVATDKGEVAVETLVPGDRVLTRDNGYQTIRWAGRRDLSHAELIVEPRFNPVCIAAGALGNGLPERDMMVSPQHRMLMTGARAEMLFGEHEVLVAAKHLVGMPGIEQRVSKAVSYIHILFDQHEIVRADGAWSESFQPGEQTMDGLGNEQREEILALFPELAHGADLFPSARMTLKAKEARLLTLA